MSSLRPLALALAFAPAVAACGPGRSTVTGQWAAVPSGTHQDLYGVWAAGPATAWAVSAGELLQWNGTAWAATQQDYEFTAVTGTSADDVWIAGTTVPPAGSAESGGPVLRHGAGGTFADTRVATETHFLGAFARTTTDAWVVGTGRPLRWDGATWTETGAGLPEAPALFAVWSAGPRHAVAVGAEVYRWDGATWTQQARARAGDTQYYFGVFGFGADDVWAVGAMGRVQHWDGAAWRDSDAGVARALRGVWGAAPNDVWAVGDGGTVVHWDGERWASVPSAAAANLRAVWGTGSGDVWAVGDGGTVVHYQ